MQVRLLKMMSGGLRSILLIIRQLPLLRIDYLLWKLQYQRERLVVEPIIKCQDFLYKTEITPGGIFLLATGLIGIRFVDSFFVLYFRLDSGNGEKNGKNNWNEDQRM